MIYVCLDCNKPQDYIFSSRRLRGIRNGSRAIDKADEEVGKWLQGDEKIRALGGVVLAEFQDPDRATEFIQKARDIYRGYGISIEHAFVDTSNADDFYKNVLRACESNPRPILTDR